tara:strand:- start:594 stop:1058 length:465 start_codon:yes stop_codon:yes gene_type:complete
MIFKRKKAKEVEVGDLCVLDTDFVDELRSSENYIKTSCSHNRKESGSVIYSHDFSAFGRKVLFEDVDLFIVKKKSIFDDVLELVPIDYHRDNSQGYVIRYVLDRKITMLCSRKHLNLASKTFVKNILDSKYDSLEKYVVSRLLENHRISFNWLR